MKSLLFGRHTLTSCAAAAILAGCAGQTSTASIPQRNASRAVAPHSHTFDYTGAEESFTVPSSVTWITVVARGAAGAGPQGGLGGRVYAQIPVTPNETLFVNVGGTGKGKKGGFNGGANGGGGYHTLVAYGGGGASDVREDGTSLSNRILVVGGGGGQGGIDGDSHGLGGKGGGSIGGSGIVG